MTDKALQEYEQNRRVKPRTFTITETDFDLVKWTAGYLQCSNSEAVRAAIRNFATHLAYIDRA